MKKFIRKAGQKPTVRMSGAAVRRIGPALLAAILVSGTGMALPAASAQAETSFAKASTHSAQTIKPDTKYVDLHFKDGSGYQYACDGGSSYPVNAVVTIAENNCSVRAWLYFSDGANLCISPRKGVPPEDRNPTTRLWISNNTAPC